MDLGYNQETRTGKSTVPGQLDSHAGQHFPNVLTGCRCQSRRRCCRGILADPRKPLCKQSRDVPEQMRGVKEPYLSWIFASRELLFKACNELE